MFFSWSETCLFSGIDMEAWLVVESVHSDDDGKFSGVFERLEELAAHP